MKKDYAKHRSQSNRHYRGSAPRKAPAWLLMLFGMLLGGILVAISYFKPNWQSIKPYWDRVNNLLAHVSNTAAPTDSKSNPSEKTPGKNSSNNANTNNGPTFDFYNVLPNQQMQVDDASKEKPLQAASTKPIAVIQANPSALKQEAVVQQAAPPQNNATPSTQTPSLQQAADASADQDDNDDDDDTQINDSQAADQSADHDQASSTAHHSSTMEKTKDKPKKDIFIINIAEVHSSSEADHKKAELALLGFDVKIAKSIHHGQKHYSVYMGPYSSADQANQIKSQLRDNQINSSLEKEEKSN